MRHETLKTTAPAAHILAGQSPDPLAVAAAVEAALDRTYGAGRWSLTWAEDAIGEPIPETVRLVLAEDGYAIA